MQNILLNLQIMYFYVPESQKHHRSTWNIEISLTLAVSFHVEHFCLPLFPPDQEGRGFHLTPVYRARGRMGFWI